MTPPRRAALPFAAALSLADAALAGPSGFASRQQAIDYLVVTLPAATAANPVYRSVKDGVVSRWLTESIRLADDGAVTVRMQERYSQEKDGKTVWGAHEAAFSLADVAISPFTEPADATPQGAPARGVLFKCDVPGCIAARWGDQPSKADMTDISLQEDAVRAKVVAAFQYLKASR